MNPDCIRRGFGPVGTNGPAESFDAVLAEVARRYECTPIARELHGLVERLAAVHARELAERSAAFDAARELMARAEAAEARADAAMGLLNTAVDVIEEGLSDRQSYDFRARAESCARSIKQALAGGERKDG